MAVALNALLPGVTILGASLVTSAGALTLAGVAVNLGGALLLSSLVRPDVPEAARPDNIQTNSKNTAGPRIRHYGLVKVGGNIVFHRAREGKSYRVIVHGHGEISNILTRYLNADSVAIDDSGFVTDDQYQHGSRSRVQMFERMGLVPETHSSETTPFWDWDWDGGTPETHYSQITSVWDEWTSAHRLDGLWSGLIISESVPPEEYRAMYPNNEPDLTVLAETTKCLDPRTGLTVFTENMALAIRDYVASPDGFNRPDAFDNQDIADQAEICDRAVALAVGGTEKLYRISGSYLLNEKPQNVLGRMLTACAGRIRLKPSGKVGLKVGAWADPEFTLLCKPKALPAIYEDTVALNVPQMALTGDYEVARHALSFEKGLLKAVGLTLRKVDSAAFTLALAEQGSVQQLPEPDTPAGENVTAAAAGIRTAANIFVAGIAVGWQAPPSDALSPLLKVTKTGDENWQDVSVGTGATSVTIPGLIDGQGYDVSLAFVTPGLVLGDTVIITNVVAAAVTDPPAPPTNLAVSDAGGSTALVEMTASTSNSLWKTEIYRDAVLAGVVYAGPGSEIAFIDNSGAGTFDWTARSVNVSNINSTSDAGPVTATIA